MSAATGATFSPLIEQKATASCCKPFVEATFAKLDNWYHRAWGQVKAKPNMAQQTGPASTPRQRPATRWEGWPWTVLNIGLRRIVIRVDIYRDLIETPDFPAGL